LVPTYSCPLFGMAFGAYFLAERITLALAVAMAFVATGI
jgi:hypothetical protein